MWKVIELKHFMKSLPRHMATICYEINQEGCIRKFYPNARKAQYIDVEPTVINGEKYFVCIAGETAGVIVKTTIPISRIMEKYFEKK
jgi:hypothetical protein